MSHRTFARALITVLAAMCVAMPLSVTAGHAAGTTKGCNGNGLAHHKLAMQSTDAVIQFGTEGGNIRPSSVSLKSNGDITATGFVTPKNQHLSDPTNTLKGLIALADSEGFFAMPQFIQCTGVNPDVASRFITIHATTGTRKVSAHGTCNGSFNQIYGVLKNVAGVSP